MKNLTGFENGEVIRARVKEYPFIFHYGIVIVCDDGVYIAHNPSRGDESPKPILQNFDDFWNSRKFEKSYGVLTDKTSEELLAKFDEIKDKYYHYILYNCEDFVNDMIGYFRFQSGKMQLIVAVSIIGIILFISSFSAKEKILKSV
jgi:hypothetical protein